MRTSMYVDQAAINRLRRLSLDAAIDLDNMRLCRNCRIDKVSAMAAQFREAAEQARSRTSALDPVTAVHAATARSLRGQDKLSSPDAVLREIERVSTLLHAVADDPDCDPGLVARARDACLETSYHSPAPPRHKLRYL
jgi:hypothetical protein